jgi:hypothetical protein
MNPVLVQHSTDLYRRLPAKVRKYEFAMYLYTEQRWKQAGHIRIYRHHVRVNLLYVFPYLSLLSMSLYGLYSKLLYFFMGFDFDHATSLHAFILVLATKADKCPKPLF